MADTVGYTGIGASSLSGSTNRRYCGVASSVPLGSYFLFNKDSYRCLSTAYVYASANSIDCRVAVYTGFMSTAALLASSDVTTIKTTKNWYKFDFSNNYAHLTNSRYYAICLHQSGTVKTWFSATTYASNRSGYVSDTYSNGPAATLGTLSGKKYKPMSIYFTYKWDGASVKPTSINTYTHVSTPDVSVIWNGHSVKPTSITVGTRISFALNRIKVCSYFGGTNYAAARYTNPPKGSAVGPKARNTSSKYYFNSSAAVFEGVVTRHSGITGHTFRYALYEGSATTDPNAILVATSDVMAFNYMAPRITEVNWSNYKNKVVVLKPGKYYIPQVMNSTTGCLVYYETSGVTNDIGSQHQETFSTYTATIGAINNETNKYNPAMIVLYRYLEAPILPLVTTWQSNRDGTDGEYNPVNNLSTWEVEFSAVANCSSVTGCQIWVGTASGKNNMWDSGNIGLNEPAVGNRIPKQVYMGSTLQDGQTYYWQIRFTGPHTALGLWSTPMTFNGIDADFFWNSNYNQRTNIRFGTSHSQLKPGTTISFTLPTGYGVRLATCGHVNEAIQHSGRMMTYHKGYIYGVFTGDPDIYGDTQTYVVKYKISDGSHSCAPVTNLTGGPSDTHLYSVIVVGKDEKIHLVRSGHSNQEDYCKTSGAHADGTGIPIQTWSTVWSPATLMGTYPRTVVASNGDIISLQRGSNVNTATINYLRYPYNAGNWSTTYYMACYKRGDHTVSAGDPGTYLGGFFLDKYDRAHILICWQEGIYSGWQRPRGISYMYSDYNGIKFNNIYEKESSTSIGVCGLTTANSPSWSNCHKVQAATNSSTNPSAPFPGSNSEAIFAGESYDPYFTYILQHTTLGADNTNNCHIVFAKWKTSSAMWKITNLSSAVAGGKPTLRQGRHGGQLIYDGGTLTVYSFIAPTTNSDYYSAELMKWKSNDLGDNWTTEMMSANSGYGAGMITTLNIPNVDKWIIYNRCRDIILLNDRNYPDIKYNGDDIKTAVAYFSGGGHFASAIPRLPDLFGLQDTKISFKLTHTVEANQTYTKDRLYQVYCKNATASLPDYMGSSVMAFYENFEGTTGDNLPGYNGWVYISGTSSNARIIDIWTEHTNKIYAGVKSMKFTGAVSAYKQLWSVVASAYSIKWNAWEEGAGGGAWLSIRNESASKTLDFGIIGGKAKWRVNAGTWQTGHTCQSARFHNLTLDVRNSTTYGYVEDNLIFTTTTVVPFNRLWLTGVSGTYYLDNIRVTKRISNEPETIPYPYWDYQKYDIIVTPSDIRVGTHMDNPTIKLLFLMVRNIIVWAQNIDSKINRGVLFHGQGVPSLARSTIAWAASGANTIRTLVACGGITLNASRNIITHGYQIVSTNRNIIVHADKQINLTRGLISWGCYTGSTNTNILFNAQIVIGLNRTVLVHGYQVPVLTRHIIFNGVNSCAATRVIVVDAADSSSVKRTVVLQGYNTLPTSRTIISHGYQVVGFSRNIILHSNKIFNAQRSIILWPYILTGLSRHILVYSANASSLSRNVLLTAYQVFSANRTIILFPQQVLGLNRTLLFYAYKVLGPDRIIIVHGYNTNSLVRTIICNAASASNANRNILVHALQTISASRNIILSPYILLSLSRIVLFNAQQIISTTRTFIVHAYNTYSLIRAILFNGVNAQRVTTSILFNAQATVSSVRTIVLCGYQTLGLSRSVLINASNALVLTRNIISHGITNYSVNRTIVLWPSQIPNCNRNVILHALSVVGLIRNVIVHAYNTVGLSRYIIISGVNAERLTRSLIFHAIANYSFNRNIIVWPQQLLSANRSIIFNAQIVPSSARVIIIHSYITTSLSRTLIISASITPALNRTVVVNAYSIVGCSRHIIVNGYQLVGISRHILLSGINAFYCSRNLILQGYAVYGCNRTIISCGQIILGRTTTLIWNAQVLPGTSRSIFFNASATYSTTRTILVFPQVIVNRVNTILFSGYVNINLTRTILLQATQTLSANRYLLLVGAITSSVSNRILFAGIGTYSTTRTIIVDSIAFSAITVNLTRSILFKGQWPYGATRNIIIHASSALSGSRHILFSALLSAVSRTNIIIHGYNIVSCNRNIIITGSLTNSIYRSILTKGAMTYGSQRTIIFWVTSSGIYINRNILFNSGWGAQIKIGILFYAQPVYQQGWKIIPYMPKGGIFKRLTIGGIGTYERSGKIIPHNKSSKIDVYPNTGKIKPFILPKN